MTPEQLAQRLRDREIPWDGAAAQKTLARVEARIASPPRTAPRRLVFVFAAVACVLGLWFGVRTYRSQHAAAPLVAQNLRATITLPDSSLALLDRDAHIDVPEHSASALSIVQDRGSVEYRVTPGLKRSFTVKARNLEIRVVGTAFTVTLGPASTLVAVDHGRVLVNDGVDTVALTAHEQRSYPITRPVTETPLEPSANANPLPSASDSASALHPALVASSNAEPGVPSLLAEADRARRAGKLPEAIAALQKFVQSSPADGRVASAAFTLGRLYRQTGNLAAAAAAFRLSYQKDASGALAEDARAQEIEALNKASAWDSARAAAKKYLELYPHGRYQSRIAPLVE